MKIKITEIQIDERIRDSAGDISMLKNSIQEVGLINPIIVNEEHKLLGGFRRLEACRQLGWSEIETTLLETKDNELKKIDIEYHENIGRLNLTIEEQQLYSNKRFSILNPPQLEHPFIIWLKNLWKKITTIFH